MIFLNNLSDIRIGPTSCDEARSFRENQLKDVWNKSVVPIINKLTLTKKTYFQLPFDLFRESLNCYQNGAYMATCAMCRASIEAILYFIATRDLKEGYANVNLNLSDNQKRDLFLKELAKRKLLDDDDKSDIEKIIFERGDFAVHIHQRLDRGLDEAMKHKYHKNDPLQLNQTTNWLYQHDALDSLKKTAEIISKIFNRL